MRTKPAGILFQAAAMTSLERHLCVLALAESKLRVKDPPEYVELVSEAWTAPRHVIARNGVTTWRNMRPKKYIRAKSKVIVGQAWLERNFPASMLVGVLTGEYELVYGDLCLDAQPYWPTASLDEEEDRLYA